MFSAYDTSLSTSATHPQKVRRKSKSLVHFLPVGAAAVVCGKKIYLFGGCTQTVRGSNTQNINVEHEKEEEEGEVKKNRLKHDSSSRPIPSNALRYLSYQPVPEEKSGECYNRKNLARSCWTELECSAQEKLPQPRLHPSLVVIMQKRLFLYGGKAIHVEKKRKNAKANYDQKKNSNREEEAQLHLSKQDATLGIQSFRRQQASMQIIEGKKDEAKKKKKRRPEALENGESDYDESEGEEEDENAGSSEESVEEDVEGGTPSSTTKLLTSAFVLTLSGPSFTWEPVTIKNGVALAEHATCVRDYAVFLHGGYSEVSSNGVIIIQPNTNLYAINFHSREMVILGEIPQLRIAQHQIALVGDSHLLIYGGKQLHQDGTVSIANTEVGLMDLTTMQYQVVLEEQPEGFTPGYYYAYDEATHRLWWCGPTSSYFCNIFLDMEKNTSSSPASWKLFIQYPAHVQVVPSPNECRLVASKNSFFIYGKTHPHCVEEEEGEDKINGEGENNKRRHKHQKEKKGENDRQEDGEEEEEEVDFLCRFSLDQGKWVAPRIVASTQWILPRLRLTVNAFRPPPSKALSLIASSYGGKVQTARHYPYTNTTNHHNSKPRIIMEEGAKPATARHRTVANQQPQDALADSSSEHVPATITLPTLLAAEVHPNLKPVTTATVQAVHTQKEALSYLMGHRSQTCNPAVEVIFHAFLDLIHLGGKREEEEEEGKEEPQAQQRTEDGEEKNPPFKSKKKRGGGRNKKQKSSQKLYTLSFSTVPLHCEDLYYLRQVLEITDEVHTLNLSYQNFAQLESNLILDILENNHCIQELITVNTTWDPEDTPEKIQRILENNKIRFAEAKRQERANLRDKKLARKHKKSEEERKIRESLMKKTRFLEYIYRREKLQFDHSAFRQFVAFDEKKERWILKDLEKRHCIAVMLFLQHKAYVRRESDILWNKQNTFRDGVLDEQQRDVLALGKVERGQRREVHSKIRLRLKMERRQRDELMEVERQRRKATQQSEEAGRSPYVQAWNHLTWAHEKLLAVLQTCKEQMKERISISSRRSGGLQVVEEQVKKREAREFQEKLVFLIRREEKIEKMLLSQEEEERKKLEKMKAAEKVVSRKKELISIRAEQRKVASTQPQVLSMGKWKSSLNFSLKSMGAIPLIHEGSNFQMSPGVPPYMSEDSYDNNELEPGEISKEEWIRQRNIFLGAKAVIQLLNPIEGDSLSHCHTYEKLVPTGFNFDHVFSCDPSARYSQGTLEMSTDKTKVTLATGYRIYGGVDSFSKILHSVGVHRKDPNNVQPLQGKITVTLESAKVSENPSAAKEVEEEIARHMPIQHFGLHLLHRVLLADEIEESGLEGDELRRVESMHASILNNNIFFEEATSEDFMPIVTTTDESNEQSLSVPRQSALALMNSLLDENIRHLRAQEIFLKSHHVPTVTSTWTSSFAVQFLPPILTVEPENSAITYSEGQGDGAILAKVMKPLCLHVDMLQAISMCLVYFDMGPLCCETDYLWTSLNSNITIENMSQVFIDSICIGDVIKPGALLGADNNAVGDATRVEIQLNSKATPRSVEALLRSIVFRNDSRNPTEVPRVIRAGIYYSPMMLDSSGVLNLTIQTEDDLTVVDCSVIGDHFTFHHSCADLPKHLRQKNVCEVQAFYFLQFADVYDSDTEEFYGGYLSIRLTGCLPADCVELLPLSPVDAGNMALFPSHSINLLKRYNNKRITLVSSITTPTDSSGEGEIIVIYDDVRIGTLNAKSSQWFIVDFESASISAVAELIHSVTFSTTAPVATPVNATPMRTAEIVLVVGTANPVRATSEIRVAPPLINIPTSHCKLSYREASGPVKLAMFEYPCDDEGWDGGNIFIEFVSGYTPDDVIALKEDDELVIGTSVTPTTRGLEPRSFLRKETQAASRGESPAAGVSFIQTGAFGSTLDVPMSSNYLLAPQPPHGGSSQSSRRSSINRSGNNTPSQSSPSPLTIPRVASVRRRASVSSKSAEMDPELIRKRIKEQVAQRKNELANRRREAKRKAHELRKQDLLARRGFVGEGESKTITLNGKRLGTVTTSASAMLISFSDPPGEGGVPQQPIRRAISVAEANASKRAQLSSIRRKDVTQLMRKLCYENISENPRDLHKVIRMTVNDGLPHSIVTGMEIEVQATDNITELRRMDNQVKVFRSLSAQDQKGFCLFDDVTLNDPDTFVFNQGMLSIDLAGGGDPKGDELGFLPLAEQKKQMPDLPTVHIDANNGNVLWNEKTVIGKATMDAPNPEGNSNVKVQFAAKQKIPYAITTHQQASKTPGVVTLAMIERVLNLVTYTNIASKVKSGVRIYQAKVGFEGSEGRLKMNVNVQPPVLWNPDFGSDITYQEGSNPITVFSRTVLNIGMSEKDIVKEGCFEVEIIEGREDADQFIVDWKKASSSADYTYNKDSSSLFVNGGKEPAGKFLLENPQKISMQFDWSCKATVKQLQSLVHCIQFYNTSQDPGEQPRIVEARYSSKTVFANLAVNLTVVSTDNPTEVRFKYNTVELVRQAPMALLSPDAEVIDPDTDKFGPETYLDFTIKGGFDTDVLSVNCADPLTNEIYKKVREGVNDSPPQKTVVATVTQKIPSAFRINVQACTLLELEEIVRSVGVKLLANTKDRNSRKTVLVEVKSSAPKPTKAVMMIDVLPPFLEMPVQIRETGLILKLPNLSFDILPNVIVPNVHFTEACSLSCEIEPLAGWFLLYIGGKQGISIKQPKNEVCVDGGRKIGNFSEATTGGFTVNFSKCSAGNALNLQRVLNSLIFEISTPSASHVGNFSIKLTFVDHARSLTMVEKILLTIEGSPIDMVPSVSTVWKPGRRGGKK